MTRASRQSLRSGNGASAGARGATWAVAVALWVAVGCGTDPTGDGIVEGPMVAGCPTYPQPTAHPGDDLGGDDFATLAAPFFADYCTRCHSTALTTAEARNNAPEGLNWDDEASVRANLDRIRRAVGGENFMPPSAPAPTCDERLRMTQWIDAGAP